jgi:hypothetical protein
MAWCLGRPQAVERQCQAARFHHGIDERIARHERPIAKRPAGLDLDASGEDRVEVPALTEFPAGGDEADAGKDARTAPERDVGDRILEPVDEECRA